MHARRRFASLAICALVLGSLTLAASPAYAAPNATMNGTGRVTVTADPNGGSLDIDCGGGKVRLNAVATAFNCVDVTTFVVNGSSASDLIDLSGISLAGFPGGLEPMQINGRGGNDDFSDSLFQESFSGGPGYDEHYASQWVPADITITDSKVRSGGLADSIASIERVWATLVVGGFTVDARDYSGTLGFWGSNGQ